MEYLPMRILVLILSNTDLVVIPAGLYTLMGPFKWLHTLLADVVVRLLLTFFNSFKHILNLILSPR